MRQVGNRAILAILAILAIHYVALLEPEERNAPARGAARAAVREAQASLRLGLCKEPIPSAPMECRRVPSGSTSIPGRHPPHSVHDPGRVDGCADGTAAVRVDPDCAAA